VNCRGRIVGDAIGADDKRSVSDEHARELAELRHSLHTTHAQLSAAHETELESTRAAAAAELTAANAEHASEVTKLREELDAVRSAAEDGSKGLQEAVLAQKDAEERVENVNAQLGALEKQLEEAHASDQQAAAANGKESGEEEKRLRNLVQALQEELENTKTVSCAELGIDAGGLREVADIVSANNADTQILDMNRSHFDEALEQLQKDHSAELKIQAEERAKSDNEAREGAEKKIQESVGQLQDEIKALKRDLEVGCGVDIGHCKEGTDGRTRRSRSRQRWLSFR